MYQASQALFQALTRHKGKRRPRGGVHEVLKREYSALGAADGLDGLGGVDAPLRQLDVRQVDAIAVLVDRCTDAAS